MKKFVYSNLYFLVVFFHFLVVIYTLILLPFFIFGVLKIKTWFMMGFLVLYMFSLIVSLLFFNRKCSLLLLQNKLGIKIGRPSIQGEFLTHYLFRPLKIEAIERFKKHLPFVHGVYLLTMLVLYFLRS